MKSTADTVDAYLAQLSDDRRLALSRVRQLIRDVAPGAVEYMKYALPRYDRDGQLFAFASQKHYMAIYLCEGAPLAKFAGTLSDEHARGKIDLGKRCVRFRSADHLN